MKEKAKSMGRSAIMLTAIGIIAKLIGALYRVPLTNIVGAEGMGLYQMVFPLYTVLLAFCGGGITSATSRVVAKYTALGDDRSARRAFRAAFIPVATISVISTVAVALLRNVISRVQGNPDAGVAYLALCPSLLFAAGISVIRGYFQGRSNMLPSGISQLIEQIVKLALGLYLSKILLPYGVKYAVAGALIGVSASELCALLYLTVRFSIKRYSVKRKRKKAEKSGAVVAPTPSLATEHAADAVIVTDKQLVKELYGFAVPVTLGSLVLPVTQMIDSALVINILMYGGAVRGDATALFGLFVGPVGTLINMPTVVALSVSVAFLPALTTAVERGECDKAAAYTRDVAKWIMLFILPVTAVFFLFPERVCATLYSRGLTGEQLEIASELLRVQAISVFYAGMLQLGTTSLQGRNKAHKPVINLVIGACFKVALTPILVRFFGIVGAAAATAACYAVAATLTLRCAYKCSPIGADGKYALVVPVVTTAAAALAFWGVVSILEKFTTVPYVWQSVTAALAFLLVYAVGVLASGALARRPSDNSFSVRS